MFNPILILKVIKVWTNGGLPPREDEIRDISEPPWQDGGQLITRMCSGGDAKDVVQLLERALFGFRDEEEDHGKGDDVHGGIETKGTRDAKGAELAREGDGDNRRPEIVGGHGPGHANLAMREREDLGRIREGHRPFAGGVKCIVDVDEEGDNAEMCTGG